MFRISWTRRIATFVTTATMAGFGLTGIASAQTITNTGPGSKNNITTNVTNNCSVRNTNRVSATNSNTQTATTGSADESGNTTASSWGGWFSLDPASAQAAGDSYSSWWNGVVNWMAQHASGSGWSSDETNLTWTPSGTNWSGFDPMTWQANGQSFGNWYNSVEAYLNSNNGVWALSWPADATGTFAGGVTSGSAINNNSANFSININNAARAAAGTNACGQSNFVPPTCTTCGGGGGMGGGSVSTPAVLGANTGASTGGSGGAGGGGLGSGGSFVGGGSYKPASHPTSSPVVTSMPSTPSTSTGGSGGAGGGGTTPSAPVSTISNTGPGSSNNVTSNTTDNSRVSNDNTVVICNTSTQTASSGNATVSGNTTTGSGGSGDASNGNATGVNGALTN